ncbi:MAG: GNAT family N-acetyltransferase [Candidatus Berkiellales bacterium]
MGFVTIREPRIEDQTAFLAMTQASRELHYPWVKPPLNHEEFIAYLQRYQQSTHKSYVVLDEQEDIVGVYNISEMVHGCFQSAYLGFYAVASNAGKGLMSEGLKLVLKEVFTTLGLHRIEANIQPQNLRSINLVKKNGFKKEGFSPRLLKINDTWCDHERWALTVEDWEK